MLAAQEGAGESKAEVSRTDRYFKRSLRESSKKVQSRPSTRGRGACYVYDSKELRAFECSYRAETNDRETKKSSTKRVTFETGKSSKKQNTGIDWNRNTKRGERDT